MPEPQSLAKYIAETWASIGPVTLGAAIGAAWKALRQPRRGFKVAMFEGVVTVGAGAIFGGLFAPGITAVFKAPEAYAFAASGALCAYAIDKVFDLLARRTFDEGDKD